MLTQTRLAFPKAKCKINRRKSSVDFDKIAMERAAESGSSFLTAEQMPEIVC